MSVTQGFDANGNPITDFGMSDQNNALYEQNLGMRSGVGEGIGGLISNAYPILSQPFDMTRAGFDTALGGAGLIESMNRPFWNAQSEWLDNRLRNQGLVPGNAGDESSAYNQNMRQLLNNQFLQFQNAVLPWQQQAADQAMKSYSSIGNTIAQLFGFTGPSFPIQPQAWQVSPTYSIGSQAPNAQQIVANYDKMMQEMYKNIASFASTVGSAAMGLPVGSSTLGAQMGGSIGNTIGGLMGYPTG
jgi:hypothetical protein